MRKELDQWILAVLDWLACIAILLVVAVAIYFWVGYLTQ